jgi:precorrin isomerase/sulfite reductase beta subunit-like hemoprotein
MESGDGLIVRVRGSVRGLSAQKLRALAQLAAQHGNGLIELTRRANLQLRGVDRVRLPTLQADLLGLGLAEPTPERESRVAGLLLDPLALLHPHDELARLAYELERALLAEPTLRLPSKFSLVLERAAALGSTRHVVADLRVQLRSDGAWQVSLAGDRERAHFFAVFPRDELVRAVLVLSSLLSRADDGEAPRMHDLLALYGQLWLRERVAPLRIDAAFEPHVYSAPAAIGLQREPASYLGLALPFGAGDAAAFEALADLAQDWGTGALLFSPDRTLLLPGVGEAAASSLASLVARHHFVVEPGSPLLRTIACAGAPACASAYGETRGLALRLGGALSATLALGASLLVSGCAKGCASSQAADFTLVHSPAGVRLGLASDVASAALEPAIPLETACLRLAALAADTRVRPFMKRQYDYERDGAAIYRRSFAIIRAEAKLARFSPVEERVAVRLIHTSGMVELADDIVFTPGFAEAARSAIRAGAPILCDANMIVSGVTRPRLSAHNDVLCFLSDPAVSELARQQGTTRSAAALTLWGPRLSGAVVAIGNAPTALFRLLELLDESDVRPAAIIGLPVGFVGAAESKQALLADGRVPAMIVRGRRGGSAMTVAAINALASDEE